MDARNRLVELEERKIPYPCRELYPLLTVVDPMPQSHTTSTVFPTRNLPIWPVRNFPLFHTKIWYAVLYCYNFPKLRKNPSSETHRYLTCSMPLIGGYFFSLPLSFQITLPSFFSSLFWPLSTYSWYLQRATAVPDHTRHTHSVGILWTRDQPDAETSTWQHNNHKGQILIPRRVSNPQSHQTSGRRPKL